MIIGSKNKGDWSEFYVLLYLLGTRNLYAADSSLNRIENFYFPINKIFRTESVSSRIDFILKDASTVEIYLNNSLSRKMTSEDFEKEAASLLNEIEQGKGSFDIPWAEKYLNDLGCERLAAPSSDITDISMELHDTLTGINQVMGFSIKSYLGNPPTLLNASGATNFVYCVSGIDSELVKTINQINTKTKIIDRINAIIDNGGSIEFSGAANNVFSENMMMIDSMMEKIIGEMLLISYKTNEFDCCKLIERMEDENKLHYPRKGMYAFKFKKFLCAKALGMDPSTEWNGVSDANGGYIVAKSNGEVLAYHLYNRDQFEEYLLNNTRLERASTSRHDYARIYQENGKSFIKFNLQIRFKSIC